MQVITQSRHFVFCKISLNNGNTCYILFLYGDSRHQFRHRLWTELHRLLSSFSPYLVVSDINQLDNYQEKIGGASLICGWEEINDWKSSLNLQDVPFFGPRFTWGNNRDNNDLIMERLDRAYASCDWLGLYPLTILRNFPITTSDHAPILLDTNPNQSTTFRPY